MLFPERYEINQEKSCLKNGGWIWTIREAGKGIADQPWEVLYRIGFINTDGQDDETEFDAYNMADLETPIQGFL